MTVCTLSDCIVDLKSRREYNLFRLIWDWNWTSYHSIQIALCNLIDFTAELLTLKFTYRHRWRPNRLRQEKLLIIRHKNMTCWQTHLHNHVYCLFVVKLRKVIDIDRDLCRLLFFCNSNCSRQAWFVYYIDVNVLI